MTTMLLLAALCLERRPHLAPVRDRGPYTNYGLLGYMGSQVDAGYRPWSNGLIRHPIPMPPALEWMGVNRVAPPPIAPDPEDRPPWLPPEEDLPPMPDPGGK